MATPLTGTISLGDMQTHISRGAGTQTLSEIRTRLNQTGTFSFSQCYGAEGFTIAPSFNSSKVTTYDGYSADTFGTISPNEGNNRVQFTTSSWLWAATEINGSANTVLRISPNGNTTSQSNGTLVTTSYKTTSVTRVVIANTSRTISNSSSTNSTSFLSIDYDMPTTGTLHCAIQF